MKTTGPVLAMGGVTLVNRVVFNGQPMDWRIPIATGITAIGLGLAEKVWDKGAVALAWLAFVTVLLSRVDPAVPSPVETLNDWYKKG